MLFSFQDRWVLGKFTWKKKILSFRLDFSRNYVSDLTTWCQANIPLWLTVPVEKAKIGWRTTSDQIHQVWRRWLIHKVPRYPLPTTPTNSIFLEKPKPEFLKTTGDSDRTVFLHLKPKNDSQAFFFFTPLLSQDTTCLVVWSDPNFLHSFNIVRQIRNICGL